jgi:hypothetical protein
VRTPLLVQRWTARREWREGRVIFETLGTVENWVRRAEDAVTFHEKAACGDEWN